MATAANGLANKQLLHRYSLKIARDNVSTNMMDEVPQMEVVTSFYRGRVDPSYQLLMKDMIDGGLFDEFIAATLQGLVHQGERNIFHIVGPE